MSASFGDREMLISLLSHKAQPPPPTTLLIYDRVSLRGPERLTDRTWSQQRRGQSGLGRLNCLPYEILLHVVSMLDMQTMTRFERVSIQGYICVRSDPAYLDLAHHSTRTLEAIVIAGFIGQLPAAELHKKLTDNTCLGCGLNKGHVLFLPMSERYCWSCIYLLPRLRVLMPGEERDIYRMALEDPSSQLRQYADNSPLYILPDYAYETKLLNELIRQGKIPKTPDITDRPDAPRKSTGRCQLTKKFQGLMTRMAKPITPRKKPDRKRVQLRRSVPHISLVWTQYSYRVLSWFPCTSFKNSFYGLTVNTYQALLEKPTTKTPVSNAERLFCWGCELTFREWRKRPRPVYTNGLTVAENQPVEWWMYRASIARTEKEFLEHVEQCEGAQQILSEAAGENA